MMKFLLKVNENDRDCVKYVDTNEIGSFECEHYFVGLRLSGACFSGFEDEIKKEDFENFTTILTKEELQRLFEFNDKIHELGYGITKDDERYNKGIKYREEIQDIIDKLNSEENEKLFKKVQKEEKEYLKEQFNLTNEDIDVIFDNYYLEYRDRAIVDYVWESIEDCSHDEAENIGMVNRENDRYFNYELFGNDLLENEMYLELNDGRIVMLSC